MEDPFEFTEAQGPYFTHQFNVQALAAECDEDGDPEDVVKALEAIAGV